MTSTLPHLPPLSESEVLTLQSRLTESGGASLDYARGVFTAAACGSEPLDPATWLSWVLGPNMPDKSSLREAIDLLVRDAQSIGECLDLGEPWLPSSPSATTQFCKGFIRVTQHSPEWQKTPETFIKVLPVAVQAGYLDVTSLEGFIPSPGQPVAEWLATERDHLSERLLELYHQFGPQRAERRKRTLSSDKVGRNEPCPCGSGKKHKKCCAH